MSPQDKPRYAAKIAQLADASEAAFALLDEAEAAGDLEEAALWRERAWRTQESLHETIIDAHFTGDDLVEPGSNSEPDGCDEAPSSDDENALASDLLPF